MAIRSPAAEAAFSLSAGFTGGRTCRGLWDVWGQVRSTWQWWRRVYLGRWGASVTFAVWAADRGVKTDMGYVGHEEERGSRQAWVCDFNVTYSAPRARAAPPRHSPAGLAHSSETRKGVAIDTAKLTPHAISKRDRCLSSSGCWFINMLFTASILISLSLNLSPSSFNFSCISRNSTDCTSTSWWSLSLRDRAVCMASRFRKRRKNGSKLVKIGPECL